MLPTCIRGCCRFWGAQRAGGTCLAALAAHTRGAAAAAGGGVAGSAVLAVAALLAAGPVETRGATWGGELVSEHRHGLGCRWPLQQSLGLEVVSLSLRETPTGSGVWHAGCVVLCVPS